MNGVPPVPDVDEDREQEQENGSGPALPQPIEWSTFWDKDRRAEDWLVEPVLPRGRGVSTYSPAKSQKSLHALYIAALLATGQRVLDRPACEPVSVVYMDLEMTEDDLAERLEDMGFGPESDLSHLHYYLLPALPPLDGPEGGDVMVSIVRQHAAELVVIDTTSRVLGGKENDSDSLRGFHQFTGLPLKALGVTLWRLDHAGKDLTRGQRGTSAKADDVDLVWELTPREDGVRLRATHRRQGWVPETVDLVRLDDPLRYEMAAESWPLGTAALAATLDRLDIPLEWGGKRVRKALKDAGEKARVQLIVAAIRYRKQAGTPSGTPSYQEAGTPNGNTPQFRLGNTPGNTPEHPRAVTGVFPTTIGGNTPNQAGPAPCPVCPDGLPANMTMHAACVPEFERRRKAEAP
jgi:hypothetical protein